MIDKGKGDLLVIKIEVKGAEALIDECDAIQRELEKLQHRINALGASLLITIDD